MGVHLILMLFFLKCNSSPENCSRRNRLCKVRWEGVPCTGKITAFPALFFVAQVLYSLTVGRLDVQNNKINTLLSKKLIVDLGSRKQIAGKHQKYPTYCLFKFFSM